VNFSNLLLRHSLSVVSTLTRDIDRAIILLSARLSVCLPVCLSVAFQYSMETA